MVSLSGAWDSKALPGLFRALRGGRFSFVVCSLYGVMRSALADALRADTRREVANLSPSQRIELAFRLGEEDLERLMAARAYSREEAVRFIARSRQIGRRFSRVASFDEL